MVVHLEPRVQPKLLAGQIMDRLRLHLDAISGIRTYIQVPPPIRIGGQLTKSLYQLTLQSPDKPELYAATEELTREMAKEPALRDVTSNLFVTAPQLMVNIRRDKAASLRINAQQLENALYDAYGPRWVSTIYSSVNQYKVMLELMPELQRDMKTLSNLYF